MHHHHTPHYPDLLIRIVRVRNARIYVVLHCQAVDQDTKPTCLFRFAKQLHTQILCLRLLYLALSSFVLSSGRRSYTGFGYA